MDKLQFTNLNSSAIYGFEIVTLILASTNHIFEVHTCIFGIPHHTVLRDARCVSCVRCASR